MRLLAICPILLAAACTDIKSSADDGQDMDIAAAEGRIASLEGRVAKLEEINKKLGELAHQQLQASLRKTEQRAAPTPLFRSSPDRKEDASLDDIVRDNERRELERRVRRLELEAN